VTPRTAADLLTQAQARIQAGQLGAALGLLREASALEPENREVLARLGAVAHALGELQGAAEALARACELEPNAWTLHNDLGAVLTEMREWERAEHELTRASELASAEPTIAVNRSTLELRRGRASEAVRELDTCLANHPSFAPAHAAHGFALRDLGQLEEAITALERARKLAPYDPKLACGLAGTLLEAGRAEDALRVVQGYLQQRPGYSGALALEALAHFALGDGAAGRRLLDFERLVTTLEIAQPPGFPSLAEFNTVLAGHVENHPSLFRAPASHATAEGLHSGSLLVEPKGPVAAFESIVGAAVSAYGRAHPKELGHPWLEHRPRGVFLKMWSVVLERGGHQIPHIHPSAWLSGVYYPKLPVSIRTGDGPAGWLEFGGSERPFPSKLELPTFRVRPQEGLLVLFPSYLFHRTLPFECEGTRVSVAFDVIGV
jgi:uncharacterized protein (TIGR02466 family)